LKDPNWATVETFTDRFSAEALVGLLASESVAAYIASDEPIPGLGRSFSVLVPTELLHRAQWIRKQATISDKDLTSLAVGGDKPEEAS
jgi:hypothetical protein